MNLSLLDLKNMRTWLYLLYIYIYIFTDIHVSMIFLFFKDLHGSSFFKIAHMPHFRNTRERDHLIMEFFLVDEWNGIANFQYRSLAGGVHVILIKHV